MFNLTKKTRSWKGWVFPLLALLFLSSCLSIDKRRYRSGYHIEWLAKSHFDAVRQDTFQEKGQLIRPAFTEQISDNRIVAEISENPHIPARNCISPSDTVSAQNPKSVRKKLDKDRFHRAEENDGSAIKVLVMLLMVGGLALTAIYKWVAWFVLAGLLSFFVLMLYVALSRPTIIKNAERQEDFSGKNKIIPPGVFFALLLSLLSCLSYFFLFGAATVFFTIAGSILSADAIRKIKKNREGTKGLGLAVVAYILNMVSLIFLINTLAVYMWQFI